MLICNLSEIPGKKFEVLGIVKNAVSAVVSATNATNDLNFALSDAEENIIEDAEELGADAIVNFTYTSIGYPSTGVIACGTAVKFI